MLKFRCRECDQKIGVPDEWAGKKVRARVARTRFGCRNLWMQ